MLKVLLFSILMWTFWVLPASAKFSLFAIHQVASLQPTETGKSIRELKIYNGSIYIGYGDYGANTGPIKICQVTPPSKRVVCEYTLSTEAITDYRVLDGKLYALSIDPSGPSQHAFAFKSTNSNWSAVARSALRQGAILPAHIFDMSSFNGSLWAVGSQHSSFEMNTPPYANDGDSTVWLSVDGGRTWKVSLDIKQISSCCSRLLFSEVLNNKLYVQAIDYSQRHPLSYFHDGNKWNIGPNILKYGVGGKSGRFNNEIIMLQKGKLVSFNGSSVRLRYDGDYTLDYTISDNYVYILTIGGKIYRSKDLNAWRYITSADFNDTAYSIEVLDNYIYLGATNAKIYRSDVSIHEYEKKAKSSSISAIISFLLD